MRYDIDGAIWQNCSKCKEFVINAAQDNTIIVLHCKRGQNMLDINCKYKAPR